MYPYLNINGKVQTVDVLSAVLFKHRKKAAISLLSMGPSVVSDKNILQKINVPIVWKPVNCVAVQNHWIGFYMKSA